MKRDIDESCIEKVYGYAVSRTYSREEADELAQEILFTAVRELPGLRDEDKFEPWLWGIAGNVTKSFRRNLGRQRAMYAYDTLETLSCEDEYFSGQNEIFDALRTKIAMLSAMYRDIIVFHYYDGLSVKQISEKAGIPEGTVSWRLAEGRRKLKRECAEMETTALRPVRMNIDIYGSGDYNGESIPFPSVYINDALSQNILYYCYERAAGVEELAKTCGVPAYYVEERLDNLLRREAVTEASRGRYRTGFAIWSDKHGIYCAENAERVLRPVMDRLVKALCGIAAEADGIDFWKAGKSGADLFYLYGAMAFDYASRHYCKLPYPPFKRRYDGNCWNYIGNMETGRYRRFGIGVQHNENFGRRGHCSHTVYHGISGVSFRQMMYDDYLNACDDILLGRPPENAESAAKAVQAGYIVKEPDGGFFVTAPAFTAEQKAEFDAIAEKHLAPLMPEYSDAADEFVCGYKKLFPEHLGDDAARLCQNMFLGMYAVIAEYAQKTGAAAMPSPGCICDVLVKFK